MNSKVKTDNENNIDEIHSIDCQCSICTGEEAYLDSLDRQYQAWLRLLD